MRTIIFILAVHLLITCGCDNSVEPIPQLVGTYQGTYSRTEYVGTDSVFTDQGLVNFEFTNRTYRCEGERRYLPPLGIGIYSINSKHITLKDTILHTGNVEILEGEFNYTVNGNNLILTQNDIELKRKHKIELTKQN